MAAAEAVFLPRSEDMTPERWYSPTRRSKKLVLPYAAACELVFSMLITMMIRHELWRLLPGKRGHAETSGLRT